MKLKPLFIGLFAVLFIAAAGVWFLNNFELRETDEPTGFQGEAATNPLFAARLFLKRMGIPAEKHENLSELPSINTVLLIDTDRYTLNKRKLDHLFSWVEQGGHLVTRIRNTEAMDAEDDADQTSSTQATVLASDELISRLGIRLGKQVFPEQGDLPLIVKLYKSKTTLEVDLDSFRPLITQQAVYKQETYAGSAWLIEQKVGKGRITLVANLSFIENASIQHYDHAEYLWYLIHGLYNNPQGVWLIHQDDLPALWRLLWDYAWPIILTLLAFIPLAYLALGSRFGPLLPLPTPERRRILEHIQASGLFMWQRYHKNHDTHYQTFINRVKQLTLHTRKSHD